MMRPARKRKQFISLAPPPRRGGGGTQSNPLAQKSHFPIDTKGLCILCYRDSTTINSPPLSKKKKNELSTRFCTLILRHLKLDIQKNFQRFSVKLQKYKKFGVTLCEDCSILAKSFCDLYSDFENVRMRMDECIKSLSDIVRLAGRIPARLKTYKERMGLEEPTKTLVQQVVNTINPVINKKGSKINPSVELAQNFRNELLQKSIERRLNRLPRISIKKLKIVKPKPKEEPTVLTEVNKIKNTPPEVKAVGSSQIFPPVQIDELPTHSLERPSPSKSPSNTTCSPSASSRRNTITITDSGKTVLLPHQVFKVESAFVDESVMDFEEPNFDTIDITEDDFFTTTSTPAALSIEANNNQNPLSDIDMNTAANDTFLSSSIVVKHEPEAVQSSDEDTVVNLNENSCKECRITLSCRAELEKHRAFIHKMTCYVQCPVCKDLFTSYFYLKRHRGNSSNCAISEEDEVREYEIVAKSVFPFSPIVRGNNFCPMEGCFEVFSNEDTLNLHLRAHGSFTCNFCKDQKQFDKGHELALHECQEHSGIDSSCEGFKCSRCAFHVGSRFSYLLHFLDSHLNINPFQERCEICQKGFVTGPDLKVKKAVHFKTCHDVKGKDPESVHICDVCQAPFLKKTQLTEHSVQIHHQEESSRKVRCGICGTEVINSTFLIKHKAVVHNNASVHEVEAQFKRRAKISNNKVVGKNIMCGCGKAFTTKLYLFKHINKVHNGVPVPIPTVQHGDTVASDHGVANSTDDSKSSGSSQVQENETSDNIV